MSSGRPVVPVAVAIVSWNTRELLRACLHSLGPEVQAGRAEVWVLDNASPDGSAEMAREAFPWAHVIGSPENLGFGAAVNEIAARTENPWLAVANADTELLPGALEALLEAGRDHPETGVLAPRLVLPDGRTQHSVHRLPTLGFVLAFNLGLLTIGRRLAARMLLEGYWRGERSQTVGWALGAFLLVRRSAFDAVGGFDARQWLYAEDLDLGWRLARAGFATRFVAGASVRHHGAAATAQRWGEDVDVRWQRSTYAWMLRRRGVLITRTYGLLNAAGALARMLLYTPPARWRGGVWWERRQANRRWARLHLQNLVASRATLVRHR